MKFKIQLITQREADEEIQELACLERGAEGLEEVGITLAEAKALLATLQRHVVEEQMAAYLAVRQRCPQCAQAFRHKDQHPVVFRTLFGNLELSSPRWFHCACQPHATRTFSPLAALLTEHCSSERLYLETKWASLVSFNLAAQLLQDVLPTDSHIRATSARNRQLYLNPEAEHYLDWFHVTMRLTVMGQYAKGLPAQPGEDGQVDRAEAEKGLERIKWYLWHGNVVRALDRIEGLAFLLDGEAHQPGSWKKLAKAVEEFHTYIHANAGFIPNYGERWRNGDFIASGFVESTVNEVVSKRMVKKQQMQWTPRGAHLLLQARTKVLNEELDQTFQRWYPGFRKTDDHLTRAA